MGREMDAAISCCYIRRAVGSDGASQPSVHIVAGNLHIVVSTEEAGQALQRETQVDPLSEAILALAEGRGDHVAVNGGAARFNRIVVDVSFEDRGMCPDLHDAVAVMFSDRGASQPAERAADMEDERSSGDSRELGSFFRELGSFLAFPRSWSISNPREELTNEANLVHNATRIEGGSGGGACGCRDEGDEEGGA